MHHLWKAIYYNQDGIVTICCNRQVNYKVHTDGGPRLARDRQRLQQTSWAVTTSLITLATVTMSYILSYILIQNMHDAISDAKRCLHAAQQRQKAYADIRRRDVEFKVGDQVLLSTRNLTMKMVGSAKLMPKYLGPFTISRKINQVAYELDLPPCMKIHNVFHVSLLNAYRSDGSVHPPPPPTLVDGELEYEVERILLHRDKHPVRGYKIKREFLIKWLGYGPEYNTWEPEANLKNCPELLSEYWASVKATDAIRQEKHKALNARKRVKAKRSGKLKRMH